ncbi:MAG: fused MFS/spermidine synthase, partial [Planctomycetota bacterium]
MAKKKRVSRSSTNKEPVSRSSAGRIEALVLTCFFFSGVTGLTYEILWTRMIVKVIGAAPFAISIVLTVFMGGLGLGSYIASRTIDRIKQPLRLVRIYGILELAIGAYGLAVPFLLRAFTPLYAVVYNQLFSHFMLYNFITFIGCVVLLCIPVICMGATLPILCRFYVSSLSHLGTHAGRLYGLNTIGAALGALLCGFWFIHYLSMPGTLILAVLINGVIGILCLRAGSGTRPRKAASDSKTPSQADVVGTSKVAQYPGALTAALVIFAVSGFCAMAYEVIWAKLLGLIVGPTTYSFTIVLVTFILGLALGSMLFGWLGDKTGKPLWLLVSTQIVAALIVLGVSQVMGNSQFFFAKLIFTFRERFALLSISKAFILFCLMIFPTLCLGATFPLVGKIYTQSVSKVGRSIGVAYAINTIG